MMFSTSVVRTGHLPGSDHSGPLRSRTKRISPPLRRLMLVRLPGWSFSRNSTVGLAGDAGCSVRLAYQAPAAPPATRIASKSVVLRFIYEILAPPHSPGSKTRLGTTHHSPTHPL